MKRFFSKFLPILVLSATLLFLGTRLIQSILPSSENTLYKTSPILSRALSIIKKEYVEEVDPNKIFEGAYQGALETIDPISSYLKPEELKKLKKFDSREAGDIGIFAIKRGGVYQVTGLIENSPAEKAGIKIGDILSGIDGTSALLRSFHQLRISLKGEPGTKVDLRWVREHEKKHSEIVRAILYEPQWKIIDSSPDTFLLRIYSFYPSLSDSIKNFISEQKRFGLKRIIFDLRNCWDGNFEEGLKLANLFTKEEKVTFQGKEGKKEEIMLKDKPYFEDVQLNLIVGKGTFGPAEIFSYLIKSSKRGIIYGEQTLGITSIQQIFYLSNGSAVIFKVKEILSPSGNLFYKEGIVPDKKVYITDEFLKELIQKEK